MKEIISNTKGIKTLKDFHQWVESVQKVYNPVKYYLNYHRPSFNCYFNHHSSSSEIQFHVCECYSILSSKKFGYDVQPVFYGKFFGYDEHISWDNFFDANKEVGKFLSKVFNCIDNFKYAKELPVNGIVFKMYSNALPSEGAIFIESHPYSKSDWENLLEKTSRNQREFEKA